MSNLVNIVDGRCTCDCGTKCPLGRIASMPKCTQYELEKAGIKTKFIKAEINMARCVAGNPTEAIPISVAKDIAEKYGYDQVIIFARKVGPKGREHMTTYGVNEEHCSIAARIGDFLKVKIMAWVK